MEQEGSKETKNPEQVFMASLVKHALGEGMGFSLTIHLLSPMYFSQ
jgi:hypothetical protein